MMKPKWQQRTVIFINWEGAMAEKKNLLIKKLIQNFTRLYLLVDKVMMN